MIVGAQLYTVREFCRTEEDFAATMEKIAAMGYTSVQVSGIGPIAPDRVRFHCDRFSLRIAVTHTPPDRIRRETAQVIDEHRILGADYIGIGSMPKEYARTPDGVDAFLADFTGAAEKLSAAGLPLLYHNHDFELARFNGQTLLEHMAQAMPAELLGFIPDTYWLQAGGLDPAAWIRRLKGRVPVVHLKDMSMVDRERIMTPVLSGNMNFAAILEACQDAGTSWLMVEQDTCVGSPLDCLAESYANLSKAGYR
jgi:sugar phosphate isomerase/epimerase